MSENDKGTIEEEEVKVPSKFKRVMNITSTVVFILVAVFAVLMVIFTILSVNIFDKTDKSLFGVKFFIVESNSMEATDFAAGDMIFTKQVDPNTLEVGDIITFQSSSPLSFGETITHKIRRINTSTTGYRTFITYGTTTDTDDTTPVDASLIIGKYIGKAPGLGYVVNFLKQPAGYIVCILLPCLILIFFEVRSMVAAVKSKRAIDLAELNAERKRIAAQQEKNDQMMEEIERLRKEVESARSQINKN